MLKCAKTCNDAAEAVPSADHVTSSRKTPATISGQGTSFCLPTGGFRTVHQSRGKYTAPKPQAKPATQLPHDNRTPDTSGTGGGHLGDVALSVRFPAARKEALSRVLHPALLTHFGDVALSVRPSAPPQHTSYLLRATGMEPFLTFSPNSSMRPLTKRHWASSRQLSGHLALRPRSGR